MDLAVVETADENSFLASAIAQRSIIGLTETAVAPPIDVWAWNTNGGLAWCGGEEGTAPSGAYANWRHGEPNVGAPPLFSDGNPVTRKPVCVALDPPIGVWSTVSCESAEAYVCETTEAIGGPAFVDETTRLEVRRPGLQVQSFELLPGVDPGNPFIRYAGAFGLRDCVDTLRPPSSYLPSNLHPAEELGEYAQLYNGIPVEGGGFVVSRAKATAIIRSVDGGLIHKFTQSTVPVIDERTASETALTAAGVPDLSQPPKGILHFARIRPGQVPSAFELAWMFDFRTDARTTLAAVVVSATTGKVRRMVSPSPLLGSQ